MKQESDVLIACTITDRIGWHKVLLPLDQNWQNLREKLDTGYKLFFIKKKNNN